MKALSVKVTALLVSGLLGSAAAQTRTTQTRTTQTRVMEISARTVQNGIELDAGSGPKRFVCAGDRVTYELVVAGRKLLTAGTFLTITFDLADNHLSMEAHDKVWPLQTNQVRLTCSKNQIQSQLGHDIEFTTLGPVSN